MPLLSLTFPPAAIPATADVLLLVASMLMSFAGDLAIVAYSKRIGFCLISTIFRSLSDLKFFKMLILEKTGFVCNILLYPRRLPGIETKNRILR